MISRETFIATHRFGFGSSLQDIPLAAKNPKSWLQGQIAGFTPFPQELKHLPSTEQAVKSALDFINTQRSMRGKKTSETAQQDARKAMVKKTRAHIMDEIFARTTWAAATPTPFMERLVHFWSNHFTVSATRREAQPFLGPYEREAIRPNILGKFSDLVLAVIQHPAMLIYLDNAQSIGPNSKAGKRRKKGLNENLARELLELHTLGVNGGYNQTDVQELAKMLTGWTVNRTGKGVPFQFISRMHEPGDKKLLGKIYKENGVNEVTQAVKDLCAHPSTARFLATKLAQHFVSDAPPQSAITALEKAYNRNNGDLKDITSALINLTAAWETPLSKAKTPQELIIATLRIAPEKTKLSPQMLSGVLKNLNHLPFSAPSPAGWEDRAEAWLSPEAVLRRVEWCRQVATRAPRDIHIEQALAYILGDIASPQTRFAVLRAPSTADALGLMLASPEFQRR